MSADVIINNAYPGVEYIGTESGAIYYEDREVDGVSYHTQNAQFSKSTLQWSLVDSSKAAFAAAQSTIDGHIIHYWMPAGSPAWSIWNVSGQGGVFNVRDFGATGNGVSDDSVAINTANQAAVMAGGGYIYLPTGTYFIESVILLGDAVIADVPITLGGDGPEFTTIRAGSLGLRNSLLVANAQWNNTSTTPVQNNIYIEKLAFDCGGTVNTAQPGGIYLKQVLNCGVSDCEIYNSATNAIHIIGSEASADFPGNVINFQVLRNHINLNHVPGSTPTQAGVFPIRIVGASLGLIQGNTIGDLNTLDTNDAIDFPGCSDVTCCDNYVTKCGDGIGTNACTDVIISNNRVVNPGGFGISTFASAGDGNQGVSNITVTGNTIIGAEKAGIRLASQDTNPVPTNFCVTGNLVILAADSAGPAGIHIECSHGSVTGNTIDLGGSANNGISIDSTFGGAFGNAQVTVAGNTINNGDASSSTGIIFQNASGPPPTISQNCLVTGNNIQNVAKPISTNWGAMENCVVRGNLGINPWGGVAAPAVSTAPIYNPFPFDIWVTIVGGSVLSVAINGNVTGVKNGSVLLPAGSNTIQLSYTSAPTWTWIAY